MSDKQDEGCAMDVNADDVKGESKGQTIQVDELKSAVDTVDNSKGEARAVVADDDSSSDENSGEDMKPAPLAPAPAQQPMAAAAGAAPAFRQPLGVPKLQPQPGFVEQDRPQLSAAEVEKQEEAKLRAKFPQAGIGMRPMGGHSAFLQKRLAKGQKFFDSGDYQMAKQKPGAVVPGAISKQRLPPVLAHSTGDEIPTPETIPVRKTSLVHQTKFIPGGHPSSNLT